MKSTSKSHNQCDQCQSEAAFSSRESDQSSRVSPQAEIHRRTGRGSNQGNI